MTDYQTLILKWAASQSELTGAVLFIIGIVCAFQGQRMARGLLAAACGGLGWLVGQVLIPLVPLPAFFTCLGTAALVAVVAAIWPHVGTITASLSTFGLIGFYAGLQFDMRPDHTLIMAAIGGLLGVLFVWANYRLMPMVVTTLQGAVLMLLGFICVTDALLPSLSSSFVYFAHEQGLIVPIVVGMLFAAGYAFQTSISRGTIETGRM